MSDSLSVLQIIYTLVFLDHSIIFILFHCLFRFNIVSILSDCLFTFYNKGCHGPNLACVVDRTTRDTLCPDVIMRCTLRMCSEYGPLAMLTVCTERTIRQLLLTVRNSAAVLDRKVLLSSFHLNWHAHFRISSTNLDI